MKKLFFVFICIPLLYACSNDEIINASDPVENASSFPFTENEVVKGMMRIKVKEELTGVSVRSSDGIVTTGIRALDNFAESMGITRMERTFPPAGKYEERTRKEGLHLWYDIWFSEDYVATRAATEASVLDMINTATPVVKVVSLASPAINDYFMQSMSDFSRDASWLPDDPDLLLQWSYDNPGTESWQEKGADIRLYDVWKTYNGHPDIIVSIVDGGIDTSHPDLIDNLWINENEIAGNGIDDDENGYADDVYGYNFVSNNATITPHRHGTHVAGTIGANNNNGIGVAGIAGGDGTPNSGVKLMSCQVFQHINGPTSGDNIANNIGAAIKYGADHGAVISQNSWGYAVDATAFARAENSYIDPAHKAAIDYFVKYAGCDSEGNQLPDSPMKGGIVLFASGNNDTSSARIAAPADYEKVLGVAAIGPDYKKASYSNYGDYMDISAPGGSSNSQSGIYSTTISTYDGGYEYRYGTSMACPHVAGVAALVIQKYGVDKRGFTARQLEEILLSTAYDVDSYNPQYAGLLGKGVVDAFTALGEAELPQAEPLVIESGTVSDGILKIKVNMELAGKARITIYNSTGSKVFSKAIDTTRYVTHTVDISTLAAGYYMLEYEFNNTRTKKEFIKY